MNCFLSSFFSGIAAVRCRLMLNYLASLREEINSWAKVGQHWWILGHFTQSFLIFLAHFLHPCAARLHGYVLRCQIGVSGECRLFPLFSKTPFLGHAQASTKVAFGDKTPLFTENKLLKSSTCNLPSFFGITISGILRD